ncbi:MAG TPA: hypothetical protein H9899_05750 [Candidatus Sphingomonas excrementigallinarum]|nr:hypothetical protein [Candidatus Sphingomonas excrementigallinarum]
MDPFVAALDAQFHAPGSAAAVYDDGVLAARPIRVIRSQPDADPSYGGQRIVQATNSLLFRVSDVPEPIDGATVTVGAEALTLHGDAMLDVEGLTWTCGAVPA